MSSQSKQSGDKITIPRIRKMYDRGEKLTMLTAYDYTMASLVDSAGVDIVLIGDSLGMVVQGHKNTLPVTIEDMVYHTRCVARGVSRAHVMADMSFLSYQVNDDEAVRHAGLLMKAGAESVKLEGGEEMAELVWYLKKVGIPVMAHIGLRPQSIHAMGGYRVQGKTKKDADAIIQDALILEKAGAFSLLLEGIPLEVAQEITDQVHIPTVGIGSGPFCNGQVLVIYDLLGANPHFKPRFVKQYMNLYQQGTEAIHSYIKEVQEGLFPTEEHCVKRDLTMIEGGTGSSSEGCD